MELQPVDGRLKSNLELPFVDQHAYNTNTFKVALSLKSQSALKECFERMDKHLKNKT